MAASHAVLIVDDAARAAKVRAELAGETRIKVTVARDLPAAFDYLGRQHDWTAVVFAVRAHSNCIAAALERLRAAICGAALLAIFEPSACAEMNTAFRLRALVAVEPVSATEIASFVRWARETVDRTDARAATAIESAAARGGLTRREEEILGAMADGFGAKRIAYEHGVAESTVRRQMRAIRKKLHIHSSEDVRTMLCLTAEGRRRGANTP